MNHTAVTNRFPAIEDNIRYIRNSDDKIAFIISEPGSVIGAEPVSFSAAFGAALWAVDFHLVAMSRGVKRVSNTMRPEATHAFWIPDDSGTKKTKVPMTMLRGLENSGLTRLTTERVISLRVIKYRRLFIPATAKRT